MTDPVPVPESDVLNDGVEPQASALAHLFDMDGLMNKLETIQAPFDGTEFESAGVVGLFEVFQGFFQGGSFDLNSLLQSVFSGLDTLSVGSKLSEQIGLDINAQQISAETGEPLIDVEPAVVPEQPAAPSTDLPYNPVLGI